METRALLVIITVLGFLTWLKKGIVGVCQIHILSHWIDLYVF